MRPYFDLRCFDSLQGTRRSSESQQQPFLVLISQDVLPQPQERQRAKMEPWLSVWVLGAELHPRACTQLGNWASSGPQCWDPMILHVT